MHIAYVTHIYTHEMYNDTIPHMVIIPSVSQDDTFPLINTFQECERHSTSRALLPQKVKVHHRGYHQVGNAKL